MVLTMPANNSAADEYVPTLLQYAEVIVWLTGERTYAEEAETPVPDHLKRAYDDAIRRESLGRVAKAMQAAEDDAGDLAEAKLEHLRRLAPTKGNQ